MIPLILLVLVASIAQGDAVEADDGKAEVNDSDIFAVDRSDGVNMVTIKKDLNKFQFQATAATTVGDRFEGDLCDSDTYTNEGSLATLLRNAWKLNDCPPKAGTYKITHSDVESTTLLDTLEGPDNDVQVTYQIVGNGDKNGSLSWSTIVHT